MPANLDFGDGLGAVVALVLSTLLVLLTMPALIRKMTAGGMVGRDVNKRSKNSVPELGGIAALFAFSVSVSFVVGLQKLLGNVGEDPFLAGMRDLARETGAWILVGSLVIDPAGEPGAPDDSTVGEERLANRSFLIDDISNIRQRLKAVIVGFAALPLMLVHLGPEIIDLPFGWQIDLTGHLYLVYWLLLVPVGVTGLANAMNMSAGYNGLESGQLAIVAGSLLAIGLLRPVPDYAFMILAALLGCACGLFYFNRYPARVFIGDIGTLGLGAALAAGIVLGHLEFYGFVAIAPAFYEASATVYYGFTHKNGERKTACSNPILSAEGRLSPPAGAAHYTLAYFLLSRHPMTEKSLVRALLGLYLISGVAAVVLSVL